MKYFVNGVRVSLVEDEELVAGTVGLHYAEFTFDDTWGEYDTLIAVFVNDDVSREQLLEDGKCEIPWEVLEHAGSLKVGVYGKTADKVRPTLWALEKTIHEGAEPSEAAAEPSQDIWQQLLDELKRIAGADPTIIEPYIYEYMKIHTAELRGEPGKPGKPGDSITVASVTESDESGGENVVMFSDGKKVVVKNGKDGKDGAPGKDYNLTESDKAEIAEKTVMLSTVGRYVTVPTENWSDDTDLLSVRRAQRVFYTASSKGASKSIIDHNWNVSTDTNLSEDWQTYEATFTYSPTDYTGGLRLLFYGGKGEMFCHPYDIADVKLWLASDDKRINLLPEDIAKLNWWWSDPTESCLALNHFSVAYDEDGHKYIHVWRQREYISPNGNTTNRNLVELRADTGVKLTAGETYVLSMRMRTTCKQHTAIAECEGIRDHSATVVSPVPTSVSAYLNNGVRAFGQRIGELMLRADTKPNRDITVGIQATRGQGTGVITNTVMPEIMGALDTALLDAIGSGVVE